MKITNNGYVGIGPNNPRNRLQIAHTWASTDPYSGNIALYVYNPTN